VAEVFMKNPTNPEKEFLVNGMMINSGNAYFYSEFAKACPDNAQRYGELEEDAKRSHLGVWKNPNSMKPSEFRKREARKIKGFY